MKFKGILLFAVSLFTLALFTSNSYATKEHLLTYRSVYPEFKPKCFYCHIDEKPKKEDGEHDLNLYGLKLKELMGDEELTEEMIQSVGNHEEFETQDNAGSAETSDDNAEK